MAFEIVCKPALKDNFAILVHSEETGATAAVDAPEAAPYEATLAEHGWRLDAIFITHHHADHTQALPELKARDGATVYGPRAEAARIAGIDEPVGGGEEIPFGGGRLVILATPGHTLGHISYFDPDGPNLFCGDALFSLGCGRMFEGKKDQMWNGLRRLRSLPDETSVYCGHEYTEANARFALSIDPDNEALIERAEEATTLRAKGENTVPFNLGVDKRANPFLRADDASLAARVGLSAAYPASVFAAIRAAKDSF